MLFHSIGVEGQNIYGGGIWFHEDTDNLYIVRNNGADGDDWSQNNCGTGGAGAIMRKVPKSPAVMEFLERLENFKDKSYQDFE